MNLTVLGISLIIIGILLLTVAPLISLQFGGVPVDVGGLTCVVIFFIPICFSVGVPPTVTALFAVAILAVFAIISYIAYRAYRSVSGHQ
ncbi:MAG: hypothetical protein RMH77_02300 [Sulfolobales archaeon]|nr:hypothetical protein [Sulfolobales archaeon]MCX8185963.1 hypothetical protein [Sulfolobales archaeon]MDW7969220.1 hypothetical protein [Sulfolobales archaeon]